MEGSPDGSAANHSHVSSEAIHAEAKAVQAKFMSNVDTTTEVVIRLDFMTEQNTRFVMLTIEAATLVGLVILVVQFVNILIKDPTTNRLHSTAVYKWNVSVGSICLAMTTATFVTFAWRLRRAHRQQRVWQRRRKRLCTLFLVEAGVQWLNLAFYLLPNAWFLLHRCSSLFSLFKWCGWVRWTCWNTLFLLFLLHAYCGQLKRMRPKVMLYIDGPLWWMWPCFIPWLVLQIPLSVAWLQRVSKDDMQAFTPICGPTSGPSIAATFCKANNTIVACTYLIVGLAIAYFALICALCFWKLRQHKKLSFRAVQIGNVYFRLQLRLRLIVMVFFSLCLVLLWLVRIRSCASFEFTWLGMMPMQVVMTANTFVWTYMCMPHNPEDDAAARRVWEQEFAWTEADKPVKLAAKALTVQRGSKLSEAPIFCFETMMHMLYWSCLVYDHKRAPAQYQRSQTCKVVNQAVSQAAPHDQPSAAVRTTLTLSTALGLYSLTDSELFWELQRDTRCLLGWNQNRIVVAFRGTASTTNVWSDLQAWRVAHPPARGHRFWGTQPLVHVGFMKSWLAGGFNQKVITRIMELVLSSTTSSQIIKIHITGHSLGGALATLAAYDIRKELLKCGRPKVEVVCYSFGAPRTGNHAFARDYNHLVPDTWSIINDQDVVTRGGKFVFLYKRPGHRVIVKNAGQMMVSPSALEASVQQYLGGQRLDQHFMSSYHHAILAVILAQFTAKGFADGTEGVARLMEASPYLKELLETQMGVQLAAIRKLPALSPQDKFLQQGNSLEGAHLPRRGFYYLKPSKATEMSSSSSERLTHSTTGTRGSWLTPWRPQEQGPATAHTSCELTSNGMDELQDHT